LASNKKKIGGKIASKKGVQGKTAPAEEGSDGRPT